MACVQILALLLTSSVTLGRGQVTQPLWASMYSPHLQNEDEIVPTLKDYRENQVTEEKA